MLLLLSFLYGKVTDLRNRLYDHGVFHAEQLPARTISIGNITVGGTGKTPLVAYVADVLARRGDKVCILTRGYGRRDQSRRVLVSDGRSVTADTIDAGDEPVMLANKLIGKAIVIADADRVSAAEWAARKFSPHVFVLDDGFQHRRAVRDLDIVCIDATDPLGNEQMLPAGRLRESPSNLARAQVVVITRANLVTDLTHTKKRIAELSPGAQVFVADQRLTGAELLRDRVAYVFCAIGNPDAFFAELRSAGVQLAGVRAFRDHLNYQRSDIASIEAAARELNAEILVTTAKDAVKLDPSWFSLHYQPVDIEVVFDDAERFASLL